MHLKKKVEKNTCYEIIGFGLIKLLNGDIQQR